ncbi:MAG: hypothetical protein EP332_11480 [Bacteroidetes bacterium]|nr:MAG: hypothetical protein EP332_11480 [Bacteroidota bacterium]
MKKVYLLSLAFVTALSMSSCTKEEAPAGGGEDSNTVPSSFTKKVLVEEFSGAWCGWCPDGAHILETILNDNPSNSVGVTLHYGDAMQLAAYNDIKTAFAVTGYPTGMIDRVPSTQDKKVAMSRSYWKSNASTRAAVVAPCGLKIDATNKEAIKVTAGFAKEIAGDVRMTVYVIEDEVTGTGSGYDQQNYLANRAGFESSPYYTQPSLIKGYKHMKVWRAVLNSNTFGDAIPAANIVAGGKFESTFSLNTLGMDESKVSIIAFVNVKGSTASTHEVLNAQSVKLGMNKGWD